MQKCAISPLKRMSPLGIRDIVQATRCLWKSRSRNTLRSEFGVNISHYAYECFDATWRYAWRCHVPRVVSTGNRRRRVSSRFDDFAEWRTHSPYGETMPRTNLRFRKRRGWARDRCITLSYAYHSESKPRSPYSFMRMIENQSVHVVQSRFRWFLPHDK